MALDSNSREIKDLSALVYQEESSKGIEKPGRVSETLPPARNLQTNLRDDKIDPNRVGLWGTVSSGKTTFLAVLYHELNDSEWRIIGRGQKAIQFILEMHRKVFKERQFPPPTPEDEAFVYQYELFYEPTESSSARSGEFQLSFVDASGEAFRNPNLWRTNHPDTPHPLDELQRCGKIICLLDVEPFLPGRKSGEFKVDPYEYFSDIFLLLSSLNENDPKRSRGQTQSYQFAFCLSKCDLPAIWEQRNNVAEFAKRILGDEVIGEIRRHIPDKNYSWHAFSAIGPYFVDQRSELAVAENKIRREHIIKPYGVRETVINLFLRDISKMTS